MKKTPTHLVVDGSNIATEGRQMPSLTQLEEAVDAFVTETKFYIKMADFLTITKNYFKN